MGGRRQWLRDDGASLAELMVVMALATVVGGLVTSGMLQLRTGADANEALAVLKAQLHHAFQRLDRDIRYAEGVSVPARAGGAWYVEYAVTDAGVTRCTQLRMTDAGGLLQSRSRRGAAPVGSWHTLASHLDGPQEFARTPAVAGGARHQRLSVTLTLATGSGAAQTRSQAVYAFTALNTSTATGDGVCTGMGRP